MYLKDVLYRQAMENGAAEGSESDDDGGNNAGARKGREGGAAAESAGRLAYNEEQQELRKAFLKVGGSVAVQWQRCLD